MVNYEKAFRGLLVVIFLISSLNICYAKDMNQKRKYISESTTVVNHMYDSVKVENKQYNSATLNYGQASTLEATKPLLKTAMENRETSIIIKYTGVDCYDNRNINLDGIKDVIEEILNEDH